MSNNTVPAVEKQTELLRKNGRFPDDYEYVGMNDGKMRFKNKSEGYNIEIEANDLIGGI